MTFERERDTGRTSHDGQAPAARQGPGKRSRVDEFQHGIPASRGPGKRTRVESIAPVQARLDATVTTSDPASPTASHGAPLESGVRSHFERAFDADLASVRVSESPDVGAHGAQAFAQGEQIAMRPGALDPGSPGGMDLLGHELTHVLQQRAGRVAARQGKGGFHQDPALEHEADVLGARAARGERVQVPGAAGRGGAGAAGAPRQARLAVALRTQAGGAGVHDTRVATIDIVGRPDDRRMFPRAGGGVTEGDHTTAWGVIRLGVVNRLRDQTLAQAVTRLTVLVGEARALPGAQADRITAMDDDRRTVADGASERVNAARATADSAVAANDVDRTISSLQTYAAEYLSYRNAIGLVVFNRGAAATSDGEPQPLQLLQHWEAHWTDQTQPNAAQRASILNAMGAVFSPSVASEAGRDRAQLPGQLPGEDQAAVQQALSAQHLATLRSSYPNLAARLGAGMTPVRGTPWQGGAATGVAAERTGAAAAIQIVVGAGVITRVTMAGRSEHGMGGSEGSHTTAHGLFERTLQRLIGQDIATARATLDSIAAEMRALPGATPARAAAMSPARTDLFQQASQDLTNAAAAAAAQPSVATLQVYAEAVMSFRNTMGLVTVDAGNVPGNHSEQQHLRTLDQMGQALADDPRASINREELVVAIARLFDAGTLNTYQTFAEYDESMADGAEGSPLEAPGRIPGEAFEDTFRAVLEQHLRSTFTAYPRLRSKVDDGVLNEVRTMILSNKGFMSIDVNGGSYLDPNAVPPPRARGNARKRPGGASSSKPSGSKRRKKKNDGDDEGEYVP